MKNIKDYLHFYLGGRVMFTDDGEQYQGNLTGTQGMEYAEVQRIEGQHGAEEPEYISFADVKPILRPLQYATRDEIEHLLWLIHDSQIHLEDDCRVTREEMVDCIEEIEPDDNAIVVYHSVRCYVGKLYLSSHSGMIRLYNEDDAEEQIEWKPEMYRFLLSLGFDLFNLIPDGLAIDATQLTTPA